MRDAIQVLLVPFDSGFRARRMGAGPLRLMASGLLDDLQGAELSEYEPDDQFRGEVASAFDIARWLAREVASARARSAFPLVLAGNCFSAVGTCAGLAASGRAPGVCWFDAHADFNTPATSGSGFLDGMALATLTGRCWPSLTAAVAGFRPVDERAVVMFGTRDIDAAEREQLAASGIDWPRGPAARDDASRLGALRDREEVYLHIDLDVLDESEASVNQFAAPGGLTADGLVNLARDVATCLRVGAMALTAYDPVFDRTGVVPGIARAVIGAVIGAPSPARR